MEHDDRFQNVTVVGAAGKMGSGILLLTALEMADQRLKPENTDKYYILYALDVSQKALTGLMGYVRSQVLKAAEKKTVQLRKIYSHRRDLIENSEIIDQYINDVMSIIRPVTTISSAYESDLVFEAASENPELKVRILSDIDRNNPNKPWFFTNTSSIPISYLEKEAGIEGRVLGVHFYNPPAVQKLVEVIKSDKTLPELADFASRFIKNLRKIEVPSNDFAGFIGNGHFMRDAIHGMNVAVKLTSEVSFPEAVYMVNKVSQDFLIRPMGIFQLIDYVGIDVCQYIMKVMHPYVKDEDIHSPLLDKYLELGVKGGQNSDGSQKDGFLKYEKGRISGVYDPDRKEYVPVNELAAVCDTLLGEPPASVVPWKIAVANPKKDEFFKAYFKDMINMDTKGALMAKAYLLRSKEIGEKLVSDKVAFSEKDVNTVLLTGFFHAYGPINNYLTQED